MATQTVKIIANPGWATPTLRARDADTEASVDTASTTSPTSTSVYQGDFTDLPAGLTRFVLESGGDEVASGWADITAETATFWVRDDRAAPSSGDSTLHPLSENC